MKIFKCLTLIGFLASVASASFAADGTIDTLSVGGAIGGTEKIPMFQTANPATYVTPALLDTYLSATVKTLTNKTLTNPTINAATLSGTLAGNFTMSGVPILSGLSAGTQVSCLGLDSGNHVVLNAAACGSGSSSVSITAATPNLVVNPNPLTGTGTIGTTNAQNSPADGGSHSYTILSTDLTKQVILASTFTAAVVPQATTTFGAGACFFMTNKGTLTATPTTSTVNGAASLALAANQTSEWCSDGANWLTAVGAANDPNAAANLTGNVAAARISTNLSAAMDTAIGSTQGSIVYRNGTVWTPLTPGTNGQFLKTQGASANPLWATVSGGSGCATTGSANQILVDDGAGACSSSLNTLILGALKLGASGTLGSVELGNATSGTIKLQPVAGALGSVTASLPANTGTIAELNLAQTWTAKQTMTASGPLELGANSGNVGSVKLYGNTSGDVTITVPAAAGTATNFKLPATNGSNTNVLSTDGAGNTSWVAAGGGSGVTCSTGFTFNTATGHCLWSQTSPTVSTTNCAVGVACFAWTGLTKNEYRLACRSIIPGGAGTNAVGVQFGEGGTPTWKTANYNVEGIQVSSSGPAAFPTSTNFATFYVGANAISTGTIGQSIDAFFHDLASTTVNKAMNSMNSLMANSGPNLTLFNTAGYYSGDTAAITAIRVFDPTGGGLSIGSGACTLEELE